MSEVIRKALRSDLPAIFKLVIELAKYEKEPEAVTTTLEDYQRDFDNNWFEAIVVEDKGKILGMAIYYHTYSTWKGKMLYLEDLIVTQSARKRGLGQLLFDAVVNTGKAKGCKVLKWQVLDWNEPAVKFYKKNKATIEKNWWNCKLMPL